MVAVIEQNSSEVRSTILPNPIVPLFAPAAAPPNKSMSQNLILLSMGGAAAGVQGSTPTCIMHSCMHQDQGQGSRICASYIFASYIHQGQISWICASYIHVSYMHQGQGTRIIDIYHTYAHHTYMHQGQETRFIDICIIHSHASGSRII